MDTGLPTVSSSQKRLYQRGAMPAGLGSERSSRADRDHALSTQARVMNGADPHGPVPHRARQTQSRPAAATGRAGRSRRTPRPAVHPGASRRHLSNGPCPRRAPLGRTGGRPPRPDGRRDEGSLGAAPLLSGSGGRRPFLRRSSILHDHPAAPPTSSSVLRRAKRKPAPPILTVPTNEATSAASASFRACMILPLPLPCYVSAVFGSGRFPVSSAAFDDCR